MQSLLERLRYTKYLHHYTRLSTFLFVIRSYHKSVTNESSYWNSHISVSVSADLQTKTCRICRFRGESADSEANLQTLGALVFKYLRGGSKCTPPRCTFAPSAESRRGSFRSLPAVPSPVKTRPYCPSTPQRPRKGAAPCKVIPERPPRLLNLFIQKC